MRGRMWLKMIVAVVAVVYLGGVGLLWVFQDRLLYSTWQRPADTTSGATGLDGFAVRVIPSREVPIYIWQHDGDPAKATIVYFHGKGATLKDSVSRLTAYASAGHSVRALEYRGFGGAPGEPSEAALVGDAVRVIDQVVADGTPLDRIVLHGWSLGAAVALQAGAARPVKALVLEAPAAALVDVAAERYSFAPVGLLMRDQWRGIDRVGEIKAPVLILHGTADTTIPIHHGEKLAKAFRTQATFVVVEGGGHNNLIDFGGMARAEAFLKGLGG